MTDNNKSQEPEVEFDQEMANEVLTTLRTKVANLEVENIDLRAVITVQARRLKELGQSGS